MKDLELLIAGIAIAVTAYACSSLKPSVEDLMARAYEQGRSGVEFDPNEIEGYEFYKKTPASNGGEK